MVGEWESVLKNAYGSWHVACFINDMGGMDQLYIICQKVENEDQDGITRGLYQDPGISFQHGYRTHPPEGISLFVLLLSWFLKVF